MARKLGEDKGTGVFDEEDLRLSIEAFIDVDDCVVYELENSEFGDILLYAQSVKDFSITEKFKTFEEENTQASNGIVANSEELNKKLVQLERTIEKEVERINYFVYAIDGVQVHKDDLAVIKGVSDSDYKSCIIRTQQLSKEVKDLDKQIKRLKRLKLVSNLSVANKRAEYQLNHAKNMKQTKLRENEEFIGKHELIHSLEPAEYDLLCEFFEKSAVLGNARETLKKNNAEKRELESTDGQVELFEMILKENLSPEDYDELIAFIKETREKVKSADYDKSKARRDESDLGVMLRGFVRNIERDLKFIEFYESAIEEKPAIEDVFINDMVISREELERNMIVASVLENEQFKKFLEEIRVREEGVIAERREPIQKKIAEAEKNNQLAKKYVEEYSNELAEAFKVSVNRARFGGLILKLDDLKWAKISDEKYEELLNERDQIKKDEKEIKKEMRKISHTGGPLMHTTMYWLESKEHEIYEAKNSTQRKIQIAELFENASSQDMQRVRLYLGACKLIEDTEVEISHQKLNYWEVEQEPYRQEVMVAALEKAVDEGAVTIKQHEVLVRYIQRYQEKLKEREDITNIDPDLTQKDESDLAKIVHDYISLVELAKKSKSKNKLEEKQDAEERAKEPEQDAVMAIRLSDEEEER